VSAEQLQKDPGPKLPVEDAVRFLIMPAHGNAYRKRCLQLWAELHGEAYAEEIRRIAWKKLKQEGGNNG
jgi:hypothetical protein